MSKPFDTKRQEVYFRAAIEMYRLCGVVFEEILADGVIDTQSPMNVSWAKNRVATTWLRAYELEEKGHAEHPASMRWENRLVKERNKAGGYLERPL